MAVNLFFRAGDLLADELQLTAAIIELLTLKLD